MNRTIWTLAIVTWMSGCGDPNEPKLGDKDAESGPYCEETATDLALDEATPLGGSAQDLLALVPEPWLETLTYADGGTTGLAFTLDASAATASWIVGEAVYPDNGGNTPAIAIECPPRIAIDVGLAFGTQDGAFDEPSTPITLTSYDGATLDFWHDLDPESLGGTFDMDAVTEEPDWDERSLTLSGSITADGTSGAIEGQISGEDDCAEGDPCTAWAQLVEVGTWGETEE